MANTMEAIGQYVQHKTPHELMSIECHRFVHVVAFAPIVFVCEANVPLIHTLQATVGNGDAVSVSR